MAYKQKWGLSRKSTPLNQEYDPNYRGNTEKLLEEVKREAANYAPEYDPPPTQAQREADPNWKFFITNRNDESDEVARTLDSLKYHSIHGGRKGRPANLKQQRAILKKYGLNRKSSQEKYHIPLGGVQDISEVKERKDGSQYIVNTSEITGTTKDTLNIPADSKDYRGPITTGDTLDETFYENLSGVGNRKKIKQPFGAKVLKAKYKAGRKFRKAFGIEEPQIKKPNEYKS